MTKVSTIDIGEGRKGHVDIVLCFKKIKLQVMFNIIVMVIWYFDGDHRGFYVRYVDF